MTKKTFGRKQRAIYLTKEVEVITLFVDGQNGLNHLVKIIGSNVDPSKCALLSLRRMLGGNKVKISGSEKFWFENRVHHPQTFKEMEGTFNSFFPQDSCGT